MDADMRMALRSEGLRLLRENFVGTLNHLEVLQRSVVDAELGLGLARRANRDYLHQIDHMLRESAGIGLSFFVPARRWKPLLASERRYREAPKMVGGTTTRRCARELSTGERFYETPVIRNDLGVLQRPVLHVAVDQGQHGMAAWVWLLLGKGLRMTVTWDVFHRVHNDVLAATSSAGLASVRLDAMHLLKYREGPFSSESNASVMKEAARDLFSSSPAGNPLWDVLYSAVAVEHGHSVHAPDFGSEEHMEQTWTETLRLAAKRGGASKTRPSRWFAFERASRSAVAERHTDLLLLLWLGCRRSWWTSMEANPLMAVWKPKAETEGEAAGEATAEPAGADEGEEVEQGVGVAELAATSMNQARKDASAKRQSGPKSGLQFCLQLLLQEKSCLLWRGLALLTLPLESFMAEGHQAVKTLRGTAEWFTMRCRTGFDDCVRRLLAQWFSEEFQELLQVDSEVNNARRVCSLSKEDAEDVRNRLWMFLVHLASEIALTGLGLKNPPFSFLALSSPYAAVANEALASHKLQWDAFQKMEKTAKDDAAARDWLDGCLIPRMQYVMETFVHLYECDFSKVPDCVLSSLQQFGRSWMSSLVCEHLWNAARRGASSGGTGRFGHDKLYHHISLGSNTLTEFGREPVQIDAAARMAAPEKLAADCYTRKPGDCSLTVEDERHMESLQPDWPTPSGASWKKAQLSWKALQATQGNWQRLRCSWLSLLARPGMLLNHKGSGLLHLCLGSTAAGMMTWRIGCKTPSREIFFPGGAKVEVHVICNVEEWNATECVVGEYLTSDGVRLVGPMVSRKGLDLVKWAARDGFAGLSLYWLKRLCSEVGLETASVSKPLTTENYVRALVTKILGDAATDDVVKQALLRRNGLTTQQGPVSELLGQSATDVASVLQSGGSDIDSDDDVADLRYEVQQVAAQEQRLMEKRRLIEAAFAVAAPPSDGTQTRRERVFVAVRGGGITAEAAKQYLPPNCRLYKDTVRENRWRLYSALIGAERSKSWGKRSQLNDWGALKHLLLLAWQAEFRSSGAECPFVFGDAPEETEPARSVAASSS